MGASLGRFLKLENLLLRSPDVGKILAINYRVSFPKY